MRQHQQVRREPVAADVRDLPGLVRVRRGQRRGDRTPALGAARVVPAVGADAKHRPVVRRQPGRAGRRPAPPGRGRARSRRSSSTVGLEPRRGRVGVRREDPGARARRDGRPCRRTSSTRTRAAAARPRSSAPTPSGSRVSRSTSTPHGPGCSTSRKARTVEAVPASGSSRPRLAAAQRKRRGQTRHDDLEQALADQPPAQHQPALLVEAAGRPGVSSRAAADLLERRAQPGRHVERSGRRAAPEPVARGRRSTHGWPARRRSTVSSSRCRAVEHVAQPAAQPRLPRGEEARRPRPSTTRVGVDAAHRVGERGEPVGEPVRPARSGRRGSRPAGASSGTSATSALDGALEQPAPGELVDADGHVQRDGVLGAGGVRGAGGQVHRQARARAARPRRPSVGRAPPTAWCRGSGRRTRRGCRSAPRSPASPGGVR